MEQSEHNCHESSGYSALAECPSEDGEVYLVTEDPADETEIDLYIELKKLLAWVASALLTEAVLDKRHDMQGIFRCGLEAVLGAWTRYDLVCAPLTRLGLAVLRRLAFDATLLSHPESMYKSSNDWVLESKGIQAAVYLLCE